MKSILLASALFIASTVGAYAHYYHIRPHGWHHVWHHGHHSWVHR